jgi:hypothetical protein
MVVSRARGGIYDGFSRPRAATRHFLHGYVVLPLYFDGEPRLQLIDFAALRPTLSTLEL